MEQSGGQAVEMTIHNFDMLRYVFGDVAQVSAVRRRGVIRHIDNNTVDDASSTLITFKNGLIGTFKIQKEQSSSAGVRRIRAVIS